MSVLRDNKPNELGCVKLCATKKSFVESYKKAVMTTICLLPIAAMTPLTAYAQVNQVTDESAGQACVAAGGVLDNANIFTAADNGTFGTASGAENEFIATNIYAPEVSGGTYRGSYAGYTHGSFSYVSNQSTRRNGGQFNGTQIDPVYGVTGVFMVSDPDETSPLLSQELTGLQPGLAYEISFWVADTEFNDGPNARKNRIAIDIDGVQEFITPFITSNGDGNRNNPVVWQKHSYVYTHNTNATTAVSTVRINETGAGGRDIFLDNIEVRVCSLPSNLVTTKTLTSGTSATPAIGETVSYDITVSNDGPGLASDVSLSDLLPDGLTIAAGHGTIIGDTLSTGGSYNQTTGFWDIGNVALDEEVVLRLVGTVDADQSGATITNTLASPAIATETDLTTGGDDLSESVTVLVSANPQLSMTKVADSQGPHKAGDVITYTYTVTNAGDVNIDDVSIEDTHNGSDPAPTPGNETLLTDVAPLGDSTDSAVDGSWDVLAPGDVVTFTGTYTVTATDVDNL